MSVAILIPAYNEESTLGRVLVACTASPDISEILVIDDGSRDETARIARQAGVRVLRVAHEGKGRALMKGANVVHATHLLFLDADLIGLTAEHIHDLITPVRENRIAMTIGLRDKGWFTPIAPRISPVLGGERALSRTLFLEMVEAHPEALKDFGIETVMNAYCETHHLSVEYINMSGVTHVIKEKKYGLWRGFGARIGMIGDILRAEILTFMRRK